MFYFDGDDIDDGDDDRMGNNDSINGGNRKWNDEDVVFTDSDEDGGVQPLHGAVNKLLGIAGQFLNPYGSSGLGGHLKDNKGQQQSSSSSRQQTQQQQTSQYEMDEDAYSYYSSVSALHQAKSFQETIEYGTPHDIIIHDIDMVSNSNNVVGGKDATRNNYNQQNPVNISNSQKTDKSNRGSGILSAQRASQQHKFGVNKNDFQLLKVIGKGAYGKVFLVRKVTGVDDGQLYAMKVLKKAHITLHTKDTQHTKTERTILEEARHPFIVRLFYAFQTDYKLYLILDYAQGGELFTYLDRKKMFNEDEAIFFSSCLLLALGHLHSLGIIYRDLKTENVLLDRDGYLKLTDFGLSKVAVGDDGKTSTMAGTVEYMACEVLANMPYEKSVDWWSLGALIFDMLTGSPPFTSNNRKKTIDMILNKKLVLPSYLSSSARDLITKLLKKRPTVRLGYGPEDADAIKKHQWFRHMDFQKLLQKKIKPPIVPILRTDEDVNNFHSTFTQMPVVDSPIADSELLNYQQWQQQQKSSAQPLRDQQQYQQQLALDIFNSSQNPGIDSNQMAVKDDTFHGFSFVASCVLKSQFEELYQRDFNSAEDSNGGQNAHNHNRDKYSNNQ
ncbi:hypothetical protein MP228_004147 [Amoeboaphelidium protococcarum]|nr:hypothetical protein MP228_004147 [Amoeboaphelidium protococcarum]